MHLQKLLPARKMTVVFNWCKRDFMEMGQRYRDARSKCRNPMDTCFWCEYRFKDGDMMALAQPTEGLNKILCQTCADKLLDANVSTNQDDG